MTTKLAYSITEVSHLLGVSRAWLYQRWAAGDGPPRSKIGSRTLIPADTLATWIEQHVVQPGTNHEEAAQ